MNIKERIQQIMDARGWSSYQLAKETGLSESTIANIFKRDSIPTFTTIETICSGFGITLSQFFQEGSFVDLSDEQMVLFDRWTTLSVGQKQLVYNLIDNIK